MTKTKIPFYPNHSDGMHCSQAVFRSLFEYFFQEKLSWSEIDIITKTISGKASWTMAAHIELAKHGVEIINLEPFDYQQFYQERIDYLKANFNQETVNYYLNKSNLMSVIDDIPQFLSSVHHETRKATISDIDNLLNQSYLVGAEINSRILNKKAGFSLHYVLIIGKKYDRYLVNDPGLPPIRERLVTQDEFITAFGGDGANGEVSGFKKP